MLPFLLLGCAAPMAAQQTAPKEVTVPLTLPTQAVMPASAVVDPDKVVLQVGETRITARQLDALIDVYPPSTQVFARGPGKDQFADTVVRMLVLAGEARKRKLDESEKFKEQLRFSEANLLSATLNELLPKEVAADEAALRKYYDAHRCEFATWKARHLLVRYKGSPLAVRPGQPDLTEDEALMRARQLRQRLATGADFVELAKAESDDAQSAPNGGDMGQIRHGQVVPTIEETLCDMNPGEISAPVKTMYGYHVIRLESKEGKDYAEMKGDLEQRYRGEMAKKQIEELIARTKVVKDKDYYAPIVLKENESKKP